MFEPYNPTSVEAKWRKKWADAKVYETDLQKAKKPFYNLVMFPYPSGDKLHVGHWYNYAPADSFGRYIRMKGFDVFEPMGFDAFGLPAENFAIKTGVPPAKSIAENVVTMTEQLKRLGCMYDWSKTLNTSDPEYYRWTQWLFLQMYEHKLAYKKEALVNWCPKDQTVLANEQVKEGLCDRCGTEVVQKSLAQWFWKITDYSEELLKGLESLDWPEKTKLMQKNWIGKSQGVYVTSKVKDVDITFKIWDSVPQTFCAQTFSVIAPEHPLIEEMMKGMPQEKEVLAFCESIKKKKAANRFVVDKEVEGIFTGHYMDNPFGTGDLPIWVASFAVMGYGSGVVHCSAHDERDFAFAKKYNIPLRPVMFPEDPVEAKKVRNLEYCYAKDPNAILEQPEEFRGRKWGEARADIIKHLEKMGIAKEGVNYRLRDWLVSRQRYWGAPIPIVYDPSGNPHSVPEKYLPWLLPTDVEFKPTGESPLRLSKEFKDRTEKIFGKGWTPEYDTMDTFVCSSFYFLRFLMQGDEKHFVDATLEKTWLPVSMYIGGPEHACMHLIYARFVMMALKDFGFVSHSEPFQKLIHQGLITNKGAKMSKSKGNVVSPDAFVDRHGADVFRMYLMFMGPFTDGGDWSDTGIKGVDRFVQRLWKLATERTKKDAVESKSVLQALHVAIDRVTKSLESLHFNTAISALMELLNSLEKEEGIHPSVLQTIAQLMSPLAPHFAEELFEVSGGKGFVIDQKWPMADAQLLVKDSVTIAIQINGKLRGTFDIAPDELQEQVIAKAKAHESVQKYLEGQVVKKEVYVKGRLVSFVL